MSRQRQCLRLYQAQLVTKMSERKPGVPPTRSAASSLTKSTYWRVAPTTYCLRRKAGRPVDIGNYGLGALLDLRMEKGRLHIGATRRPIRIHDAGRLTDAARKSVTRSAETPHTPTSMCITSRAVEFRDDLTRRRGTIFKF